MKVLTLKLGNKTFTTGKITAFMSKEAIKINKDALRLAKIGQEIQQSDENDIDLISDMLEQLQDLSNQKAWLITKVYEDKFTVDELENNLSSEEIDDQISLIINGISGIARKN